ncbi:MAG: acyl-CoA dehydrogenase [Methylohalobius crimeensis]
MALVSALISAFLILAFTGAELRMWSGVLIAILTVGTLLQLAGPYVLSALWLSIAIPLTILSLPPLRRRLLSAPAMRLTRKVLPELSRTEQEALEAGDAWWEAELLGGRPNWRKLLAFPRQPLTEEEQAFLDGPVEELCRMLDDWKITHRDRDLPPEVWRYIRDNRFFGLILPQRYGGLAFSARAHSEVVVKIASRSITAAVTVMVPNSLGPGELILKYGSQEQKDRYLPRLASGEEIPCFALTGPEAGSDAGAMTDTGVVCRQDFEGRSNVLGIRLNWDKRYITLAPVATLLGLAFKLQDPDRLLSEEADLGITLALIPTATPGVETGDRHNPMDIPFQNGPTRGHDVFIPLDWLVGGREGVGQGWRMLMECLAEGRGISLPALATAGGKVASRTTGAYARNRRQFRVPIGAFEGIAEALGKIGGLTYVIDAARILTVDAIDRGIHPTVASAIIKYHLTEAMRQLVNDAMDVHGGKTIIQGPHNHLSRLYQSIPISITVEGANILTRNMIIYGQGAIRCHPYLLTEMHAAQALDLTAFDRALTKHLGLVIRNKVRAILLGLTHGRLAPAPSGPYRRTLQHLTRFSAALAFLSDVSLGLLGGELKRRERVSARLGDILSHLYLASALLRHHQASNSPQDEAPLLEWGLAWCLSRMEGAMVDLLDNYPAPWLGWILKRLVLPWGRQFSPPADRLDFAVSRLLQAQGPARDRLTAGIFMPSEPDEPVARLEAALASTLAAEPIERRIKAAVKAGRIPPGPDVIDAALGEGLIDSEEAERLRQTETLTRQVIAVDAFPPQYFESVEEV